MFVHVRRGVAVLSARHLRRNYSSVVPSSHSGLFGLTGFHSPADLLTLASRLTSKIANLSTRLSNDTPSLSTIQLLDEISNSICEVLDVAELCKIVHPSRDYVASARQVCDMLQSMIIELNTHHGIYGSLSALERSVVFPSFTREQRRVVQLLRKEMENAGILLVDHEKRRAVELQDRIYRLCDQFLHNCDASDLRVEVPIHRLTRMPPNILRRLKTRLAADGTVLSELTSDSLLVSSVLKWAPDPTVRKAAYVLGNYSPDNVQILEELRACRHELAATLGFPSFTHMSLTTKMAKSPENVSQFVDRLARHLPAKATREMTLIGQEKIRMGETAEVFPWDTSFYMGKLLASTFELDARQLSCYFPLPRVLEGLHLICQRLFGISLSPVAPDPAECWASEVQKFELKHETEGVMGFLYMDLYARPGKLSPTAQYTIRAGRRISPTEYQLPVVALVCNFSPQTRSIPLLTTSELNQLFHEFGHALHSILSRTEFQHVAGGRGELDFVETPSTLFEYFAEDYRVLRHFARHFETNEVIPEAMVQRWRASRKLFAGMTAQESLFQAMLDQACFGVPVPGRTALDLAEDLQRQYTLLPVVAGVQRQTVFGHLASYGGGCYTYVFARVFASHIWAKYFEQDPLSREAGERYRRELLHYGGSRDPEAMLTEYLGERPCQTWYLREIGIDGN
eukprot:GILJ01012115.1.p1 GENE.GILJ01012115.1~~GILJ01012115.1.p1  ORF type:complete len:684 (+),score=68.25 GILJ01012115.1:41-2092(+)